MTLPDRTVVRIVVGALAGALLLSIAGIILMIETGKDPKDILPLATGALGALGGILAKTSTETPVDPTPVTVVDQPAPVPVTPVDPAAPVDGGGDESGGVATRRPRATTSPRRGRGA